MPEDVHMRIAVGLLLPMVLGGCAGLRQGEEQVFMRESGRELHEWVSAARASELHWPYAWSAVAAYQYGAESEQTPTEYTTKCPEPHSFLRRRNWKLWDTLPLLGKPGSPTEPAAHELAEYRQIGESMRAAHLRAEVWSNEERKEVIVAFGGTATTQDWKSNLHWLLKDVGARDQYDVLSNDFVRAFAAEYERRAALPDGGWLRTARVTATGHSLGAGLAQRFAYSIWSHKTIPFGKQVFAFDPSPVSAKRSTDDFDDSSHAYDGLTIYRIYNRGEILASVRSILQWGNPGNSHEQGQTWIDIRYKSGWTPAAVLPTGAVHAHSMLPLACFMKLHLPDGADTSAGPPR